MAHGFSLLQSRKTIEELVSREHTNPQLSRLQVRHGVFRHGAPISFKHYVESSIPFYSFLPEDDVGVLQGIEQHFRSVGDVDLEVRGGDPLGFANEERRRCGVCQLRVEPL
jgi:hypothetical protein